MKSLKDYVLLVIIIVYLGIMGYIVSNVVKQLTIVEMPIEIRDVTKEDLQLLIDRARVSGNTELESILHAVAGALETKTLAELANYTTKYSKHMLEEHYKPIKKLNMI